MKSKRSLKLLRKIRNVGRRKPTKENFNLKMALVLEYVLSLEEK
jgi:hypothetical protein